MTPADHLLPLIHQLYAAPGTVDGWQVFLDGLRVAVNGSAASFISHNLRLHRANVAVSAQIDPDVLRLYEQHWGPLDPWACSPKLRQAGPRAVIVGDELISHSDMKRTAYYQDFARPHDIVRSLAGFVERGPDTVSVVSISGSERRGAFGKADTSLLEPLVPHIQRALQLHRRLIADDDTSGTIAGVLNASTRATLLVNRAGKVSFMNQSAERLTALRDGLSVEAGELRAPRSVDTARLRSLVADAVEVSNGRGVRAGGVLALGRPSGRRAFAILVCAVPRHQPSLSGVDTAAAIVFVTDPDQATAPDEHLLSALFDLTPAEATLARLLAQGATLAEAGVRLGLRRETVRTRIKSVFQKTNTHRQAELVRLLLVGMP